MSLKSYRCRLTHKRWKMYQNRCHLVQPHSKIQTLLIKWCWISTVWHISRVSPGAKCASTPDDATLYREQPKIDAVAAQLQFNYGYMGDGGLVQIACFRVGTDTSSGAIHATMVPDSKNMDIPYVVARTVKSVRDLGCSQHTEIQRHGIRPVDIRSNISSAMLNT